jgi:hypothetical protein
MLDRWHYQTKRFPWVINHERNHFFLFYKHSLKTAWMRVCQIERGRPPSEMSNCRISSSTVLSKRINGNI